MAQYAVWSSVVLANIGFLLISVCTGTDYWVSRIRPSFEANEGLFFHCISDIHDNGEIHRKCERLYENFGDLPALYMTILSLMLGASLLHFINIILFLVSCCLESSLVKILCALEIASVMASVAGLSAYVRLYDSKYYGFGWSYFVGWVGVFFVSIAVVLIVIDIERQKHSVY